MSLALYRKYRPGSFAEVKGQEHVTAPLRQALLNGRIHHAYLFSGPRGCGKTSSARILARSLNCAQGPTPDPCGVCDSCVALAPNGAGSLDVIEIDAASHNGVDDARDLREKAIYAPVSDRFKVYIIDEAHMITSNAFNALLKLVEEPPEFVKFVFATTEPEKVLQTIRSRTHHYSFRLMPRKDLTGLLEGVIAAEGIAVDPQVVPLVVRAAAGSARDGLSILDQVLAGAGPEGVTREAAADLLGVTPDVLLDDVLDAFAVGDAAVVFGTVDRVMEGGHDPKRFAADVLERLRDLVILDAVPDAGSKGVLDCPAEQLDRMARQAAAFGAGGLSRAADLFAAALTDMRGTAAPRLLLELVCARVLLPTASSEAFVSRVERLERRFDIGAPAVVPTVAPRSSGGRSVPRPEPVRPEPVEQVSAEQSRPSQVRPSQTHPDQVRPDQVRPDQVRPDQARPDQAGRREPDVRPADGSGSSDLVRARTPPPYVAPSVALPQHGGPPRPEQPRTDETADGGPWPSAWPTTAVLGRGAPDAPGAPAPAAAPDPPTADPQTGGLDAAEVRRTWDTVLERVKASKRVTHARLCETTVAALEGRRLSVSFPTPTLARQFSEGVHVEVLKEALRGVLGADLDVVCLSGGLPPGGAPPGPPGPSTSRGPVAPPPPPAADGFAPGDEAADDDGEAPPAERGEDAALRLVQQALGGRVVGTIGE